MAAFDTFSLRMPVDLGAEVRQEAVDQGVSVSALINKILEEYMRKQRAEAKES